MKLLREEVQDTEFLIEEKDGKKNYFIHGVFMQAEKQNKNGRVYPRHTLQREVDRYNEEYVKKNRAFGELNHPPTPSINLDRVSHLITELKSDGNNFMGKAKIVDTPNGNTVKGLLESGACLGVSTRGVGSLKPVNGYQLVQDDFKLATAADIVADPSAPDAFVQGIMENYDWWMDSATGEWHCRAIEESRREIREIPAHRLEEEAIKVFSKYMKRLSRHV